MDGQALKQDKFKRKYMKIRKIVMVLQDLVYKKRTTQKIRIDNKNYY